MATPNRAGDGTVKLADRQLMDRSQPKRTLIPAAASLDYYIRALLLEAKPCARDPILTTSNKRLAV